MTAALLAFTFAHVQLYVFLRGTFRTPKLVSLAFHPIIVSNVLEFQRVLKTDFKFL